MITGWLHQPVVFCEKIKILLHRKEKTTIKKGMHIHIAFYVESRYTIKVKKKVSMRNDL